MNVIYFCLGWLAQSLFVIAKGKLWFCAFTSFDILSAAVARVSAKIATNTRESKRQQGLTKATNATKATIGLKATNIIKSKIGS